MGTWQAGPAGEPGGLNSSQQLDCSASACYDQRDLLELHGWTALQRRSYITDVFEIAGERIIKIIQARAATEPLSPPPPDDLSGVYLLGRA